MAQPLLEPTRDCAARLRKMRGNRDIAKGREEGDVV